MSRLYRLLAIMALILAGPVHAAVEYADVTGGRVKGEVGDGLAVFKGIPFAAPPIGALRWRVPQPVVPWSDVRSVNTFAPACVQVWYTEPNPSREDCLYLNVWTAATTRKERRPVMVWIHGGGFLGGWSWERLSDGTKLAREGVVLVTIAYRLGVMGFLAHPELTREHGKSSGNYGLHDVVAALQWVHANIAQFGGDPSRVTIFGGSAGGVAIGLLAGAPTAKGLYARAIAESGSGFLPQPKDASVAPTLSRAEKYGESLFGSLGASDLKSARKVSAEAVLKASLALPPPVLAVIDGDLINDYNVNLFREGRFNDTPVLVGFTSDEMGDTGGPMKSVLAHWPCNNSRAEAALAAVYPQASIRYLGRDTDIAWPAWTWARLQTSHGRNPAYLYVFDVRDREHPLGAPHASDYPYTFGNFPNPPAAGDEAVSSLIRKYWINFAARGDPNGPDLPAWKKFDEHSQAAMVFDDASRSRQLPNLEQLQALDATLSCAGSP